MITLHKMNFNREIKEIRNDLLKRRTCESNLIVKVIEEFNKRHSSITRTSGVKR